jgi:hypothetical protein
MCPSKIEYYFLFLDEKKVIKEKSRLQNILGFMFLGLPTQYNSLTCGSLKQYCLQQALTANLKTFTSSQNVLRPGKIHILVFYVSLKFSGAMENRKRCEINHIRP